MIYFKSSSSQGKCDLLANVICPGVQAGGTSGGCAPKSGAVSGDVNNVSSCGAFQYCNNGALDPFIDDCSPLHFDPDTEVCSLPESLATPCTEPVAPMMSMRSMSAPAPLNIPKAPEVEPSVVFHRFMRHT